jgi:hypothetical protein
MRTRHFGITRPLELIDCAQVTPWLLSWDRIVLYGCISAAVQHVGPLRAFCQLRVVWFLLLVRMTSYGCPLRGVTCVRAGPRCSRTS